MREANIRDLIRGSVWPNSVLGFVFFVRSMQSGPELIVISVILHSLAVSGASTEVGCSSAGICLAISVFQQVTAFLDVDRAWETVSRRELVLSYR